MIAMKTSQRLFAGLSFPALAILAAGGARAEGFQFGVRAGGNYSDNALRVPEDETSASSGIVGIDFSGQKETGRLRYDAFGNVEYQHFFDDDVDDETYGQAVATSSYAFVPDRFLWSLSGSYGQTRANLLRPVAPGNVDDVITLSTGPQVTLRFANSLEATLEGHYVVADYSEEPFDSDTVGGSLLFGRRVSAQGFLGIGGSVDEVSYDFEAPGLEDFDRNELFLRFNARGARTTLDLDAGYTTAKGDTFDQDGPLFRLHGTRQLTPGLSAYADFVQEFPTSSGASFAPGSPPQLGTDSSVLTGGPRKSRDAGIGLQLESGRTDARLGYVLRKEEELESGDRRDIDVVRLSGTYLFAPRASFTLFASFSDEEVEAVEADEQIYGGRLSFQLGRLTSLSVRLEHRNRDSDALNGSYEENAGGIFLRYGDATGAEGWR